MDFSWHPPGVTELRIINKNPASKERGTWAGFFDDATALAKAAKKWDGKANLYVTLNTPDEAVMKARHPFGQLMRCSEKDSNLTADSDIERRVFLPLDFDPVRPRDVSSTDLEHQASIERAMAVRNWLSDMGFPDPLLADSGNGSHLLYSIDLPNNDATRDLVSRCLQAVAWQWDDDRVKTDTKVFNAARIWKLYGTMAVKGQDTPDRPHRRAAILEQPAQLHVVTLTQLEQLAARAPKPPQRDHEWGNSNIGRAMLYERIPLVDLLHQAGLHIERSGSWQGGTKHILNPCPWNDDHRDDSAYVLEMSNGALSAGCHHNGCTGQDWFTLKDIIDPGWRERAAARKQFSPGHEQPVASFATSSKPAVASPVERVNGSTLESLFVSQLDPGLYGTAVRSYLQIVQDCTEACNEYHVAALMAVIGCALGRSVWMRQGMTIYPNLYMCLIGNSGRSCKSTAANFAVDLFRKVEPAVKPLLGVGSAESLLENMTEEPSIDDPLHNRCLFQQDEMANFLGRSKREGTNNMVPTVVSAYDCPPVLESLTRKNPITVVRPALSFLACSTPTWLTKYTTMSDILGGFTNRFMFVDGVPKPPIDDPPLPEEFQMEMYSRKLRDHVTYWMRAPREIGMSQQAKARWSEFYHLYRTLKPSSELSAELTQRSHTNARKIAMIHAVMDGHDQVELADIEMGIGLSMYAGHVVTTYLGLMADHPMVRLEKSIERRLKQGPHTARVLSQYIKDYPQSQIQQVLDGWTKAGVTVCRRDGRTYVYELVESVENVEKPFNATDERGYEDK